MKISIAAFIALMFSIPACAQNSERLLDVSSYNNGTTHVEKYIDREKTVCQGNDCLVVDVSIISDGKNGTEPGTNRSMFVALAKFDLSKRAVLFITVAEFNFVDGVPKLKMVMGSPEHPATSKWLLVLRDNPLNEEIDVLIKHAGEFEQQKADPDSGSN